MSHFHVDVNKTSNVRSFTFMWGKKANVIFNFCMFIYITFDNRPFFFFCLPNLPFSKTDF